MNERLCTNVWCGLFVVVRMVVYILCVSTTLYEKTFIGTFIADVPNFTKNVFWRRHTKKWEG